MSNQPVIDIPMVHEAAFAEQRYRVPIDALSGREPGRPMGLPGGPMGQPGGPMGQPGGPMGQLFPVMAVLLAQVLDLDQTHKDTSR